MSFLWQGAKFKKQVESRRYFSYSSAKTRPSQQPSYDLTTTLTRLLTWTPRFFSTPASIRLASSVLWSSNCVAFNTSEVDNAFKRKILSFHLPIFWFLQLGAKNFWKRKTTSSFMEKAGELSIAFTEMLQQESSTSVTATFWIFIFLYCYCVSLDHVRVWL